MAAGDRARANFVLHDRMRGIDTRIDPPPAASDWRNRPPTAEEVDAHDGLWVARWPVDHDGDIGLEVLRLWISAEGDVAPFGESRLVPIHASESWRPYDRDGTPVAWPTEEATSRD